MGGVRLVGREVEPEMLPDEDITGREGLDGLLGTEGILEARKLVEGLGEEDELFRSYRGFIRPASVVRVFLLLLSIEEGRLTDKEEGRISVVCLLDPATVLRRFGAFAVDLYSDLKDRPFNSAAKCLHMLREPLRAGQRKQYQK